MQILHFELAKGSAAMAHAAGDAHEYPVYGYHFRAVFPILDNDGDLVAGAAGLDSERSIDQATAADCTNEATEIATSSGTYYLDLTGAEMTSKCTSVVVKSSTTDSKDTVLVFYPRRLPALETGTAQAGAAGTITLASGASAEDDFYNGLFVGITNDTPSGVDNQLRRIVDYNGTTKVATVDSNWGTNPSSSTTYEILIPEGYSTVAWGGIKIGAATNRGLTALPAAAADAAGGLPISDAGGLDLDTFLGRITGNVALASVLGALNTTAATGDPTSAKTTMGYVKQLVNVLVGTAGVATYPAAAAPGNAVSLAEVLRAVYDDTNSLDGTKVPDTVSLANINAEVDTALTDYDGPTRAEATADKDELLDKLILEETTIATLSSQTSFTLTAGSADDDAYNGCTIVIEDASTAVQRAVGLISDYTGLTRTVTLAEDPGIFTMATSDKVRIFHAPKQLPDAVHGANGGLGTVDASNRIAGIAGTKNTLDDLNDVSTAQVNTEVDTALADIHLDHLLAVADPGGAVANNSFLAKLVSSSATATFSDYVNTTDSLQALRDHIGDGTNLSEAGGTGDHLTAIPWNNSGWDAEVQSEVDDALVARSLHLLVDTALPTNWATDVTAGSALDQIADDGTATFDRTTDSLQAIRDRGDAAWTSASAGLTALASGTAQAGTASTIQLAAASTFADNEMNGNVVKITSGTGAGQARVITAYTGATDTATIAPNWATNPDNTSVYEVVEGSVNVATLSLDATAADNAEAFFDDSGFNASNSTIGTCTTNTDMRGTDSAALASVVGALNDAAAAGDPTASDTLMQYAKQLVNVLVGTTGVTTWPASAAPGNNVSIAEALRAVYDDTNSLDATKIPDTISLANINGEVLDVLNTDTFAELGAVPAATSSLVDKISWVFMLHRNRVTQTSSTQALRNDANSADLATAGVSDDGTTFARNEWA